MIFSYEWVKIAVPLSSSTKTHFIQGTGVYVPEL